jgi:integrase
VVSVRKRKWKTKEGEDREGWLADYRDQAGKRHQKLFARKKEADAFLAQAKVEVRAGIHTADSESVTVDQAAHLWLETCQKESLERSTIDQYRRHVKFHIRPFIGSLKLSHLTAPMIRAFEDDLRKGDDARSPAMTKKILTSLASLIGDAQERGLIAVNVARYMRKRRRSNARAKVEKRQKGKLKVGVHIPTPEEIKTIIRNLDGRWRPILLTAIFTGLRSSELRGLRWQDVDLKKKEVHVRQRVDQYGEFGPPKSEAGERVIPLSPELVKTLREWKLRCPKGELDLAFPTGAGTPENHANVINRGLGPAQVSAGIVDECGAAKYSGLHALRHFYASWCINAVSDGGLGLSAKIVQARMGHSSITMTLDTYGHLFPRGDDGSELAAAEKLFFE